MAVCFNDTPENRPTYTTSYSCGNAPNCRANWVQIRQIKSKSAGPDFCFGDTGLTKVNRTAGVCRRESADYPADDHTLVGCCADRIAQQECKPGYCPGSSACNSTMQNYCATRLDSGICQVWCNANKAQCNTMAQEFCRDPIHHDAPFCACINSPVIQPTCFNMDCINFGYVPPSTSPDCSDISVCNQYIDIKDSTLVNLDRVSLNQVCSSSNVGNVPVGEIPFNTPVPDTATDLGGGTNTSVQTGIENGQINQQIGQFGQAGQTDQTNLLIGLVVLFFVFLIIIAILIATYIFRKPKQGGAFIIDIKK